MKKYLEVLNAYLEYEKNNLKKVGMTLKSPLAMLKQKHAINVSDALVDIESHLFSNQDILKLVYYEHSNRPLNEPDLTPAQIEHLKSRIVGNERSHRDRVTEIRFYFDELKEDNLISYDVILRIDIFVPEECLRILIPETHFFGLLNTEKEARRQMVIAHYIEKSLPLWGYRHIGTPNFNRLAQKKSGDRMAKVSISAKIDMLK